jgi:RsiW-degrading membrane proteinase PrsW (M82 family)
MEGNGTAYIDSTNISTQAYLLIVGMVLILIVLSYSLYFSLKQNNKKINILSITIVATMIALIAPLIVLFTIKPTLHNLFSEDGSSPYFTS